MSNTFFQGEKNVVGGFAPPWLLAWSTAHFLQMIAVQSLCTIIWLQKFPLIAEKRLHHHSLNFP